MSDMKAMTDEQLAERADAYWREAMRYEAASRGFDHKAAKHAWDQHYAAKAELELRRCRTLAKPVCDLIDALVGEPMT